MAALPHFADERLEGLLTLDDAVEAMRAAFLEHGRGAAPVQLRTPTDVDAFRLNTMAAAIPALGVAGAKVYTAFRSRFSFVIVLFSMEDGRALATFDANALTRLRTAAVSVLACERLARADSRVLAVFGAGVQARAHAEAFAARFPLDEIRVVARSGAEAFAAALRSATGVEARACDAAAEALDGAHLVVTATRTRTPLFDGALLPPGCTVAAVGSSKPDTAELDAAAVRRFASIVVESLPAARHEAGDLLLAAQAGVDPWPKVVELGELLARPGPLRRAPGEIHCFESLGLALEDVAIAAAAWSRLHT